MKNRGGAQEKSGDRARAERFSDNSAVRELLDHLAEELAKEYISLMRASAEKPANEEGE